MTAHPSAPLRRPRLARSRPDDAMATPAATDLADGSGPYARHLLKALKQPESPIEELLSRLGRPMRAARQWPRMIRALAGRPGAPDCFLLKALLT